ncbi:MAG: hypothetical protein ABI690_05780 [Chloroflexota bacterium]
MADNEWMNFTWDDCVTRYESLKSYTSPDNFVHICAVHMLKLIEVIQKDETFPQVRKVISHEMLRLTLPGEKSGEVDVAYYDSNYYVGFGILEQVIVPFEKAVEIIKHYLEKLDGLNASGVMSRLSTHSLGGPHEKWEPERIQANYENLPPMWMYPQFVSDLKLQLMYAKSGLEEYVKQHNPPNTLITKALDRLETIDTLIQTVEQIELERRSENILNELDK